MRTVISNPPYSISWDADVELLNDARFSEYGKLAPKSKADYAFIQDMIYQLDDNGVMAVVLPHGVLFRGSSEGVIRQYFVEEMNVLDAVIGLPENLFFNTSIPTCILIFKKNRNKEDGIFFIDSSKEFEKLKTKNNLTKVNILKIRDMYLSRKSENKYSRLVSIEEIAENDYNLNIPRYIETYEEPLEIDIESIMSGLDDLYRSRDKMDLEINEYFYELGLKKKPFQKKKNTKKINQNHQQTLFDYDN